MPSGAVLSPKVFPPAVIQESTLSNGITIITRDNFSPVVHLNVSIRAGSSFESHSQKGAAQLLSAGAFSGNPVASGLSMIRKLEDVGALVSVTADRDKISYKISVLSDEIDVAISTIACEITETPQLYRIQDMKEKASLFYDKLSLSQDLQVQELLHEAAYGEDSAFGSSLYAPLLSNLSSEEIVAFRAAHFNASNLIIAASGIAHADLRSAVEKHFAQPAEKKKHAHAVQSAYIGGEVKVKHATEDESSHIGLAFPVPAGDAGKAYDAVLEILSSHVGSADLKAGSVTPFLTKYSIGGLIGFAYTGTFANATAVQKSIQVLKDIASGTIKADSASIEAGLKNLVSLESGASSADFLVAAKVRGGAVTFAAADVSSVSAASVAQAAKAILASKPAFVVLGNTKCSPSYQLVQDAVK